MVHYETPWEDEAYWKLMNDSNLTFDLSDYAQDALEYPYFEDHHHGNGIWTDTFEESFLRMTSDEIIESEFMREAKTHGSKDEDEFSWIFKAFEEIKMSDSSMSNPSRRSSHFNLQNMLLSTNSAPVPTHSSWSMDSSDLDRFFGAWTYLTKGMIDRDVRQFYHSPKDFGLERKIKIFWD